MILKEFQISYMFISHGIWFLRLLGFLLAFILLVFVVYSKNMNTIEEVSDNLSVNLYLLITAVFFFF